MGCLYSCWVNETGALRWVEENADNIDEATDLEALQDKCCPTFTPLELLNEKCCRGFTPLKMALIAKRRDVVEKLIARGAWMEDLDYWVRDWEPDDIRAVLDLRPDKRPSFRMLEYVIKCRDVPQLEALLDQGAGPNSHECRGDSETPFLHTLLHVAVQSGDLDCVKLLLTRGAALPPDIMHDIADRDNALAMAHLFLSAGAAVNSRNAQGESPLWSACSGIYQGKEREALVTLLIKHGAEVNAAPADSGTTPLMFAAARGEMKVMSLLLGAGADSLARDSEGRTALDFARMRNRTKAAEMLLLAVGETEETQG